MQRSIARVLLASIGAAILVAAPSAGAAGNPMTLVAR